jgi:uncharacterized membrane protein
MTKRTISLYIQSAVYLIAGIIHFINPEFYISILPNWFPLQSEAVFISGIAEIILALGLLHPKTQKISAFLITAMLIVFFFLVHIPMLFNFHGFKDAVWWIAVIRIPIQFVLIAWSWYFVKNKVNGFRLK